MCQKGYELTIVYTALCLSFLVKNLIEMLLNSLWNGRAKNFLFYYERLNSPIHEWKVKVES